MCQVRVGQSLAYRSTKVPVLNELNEQKDLVAVALLAAETGDRERDGITKEHEAMRNEIVTLKELMAREPLHAPRTGATPGAYAGAHASTRSL
ncbi:hypothetical protein V502_06082 [Pseudogymnoascus sp. VKM F-4520 (FW-2644)]|nr:hypothetical protein V502_06082 [Pseudogymnoascus sp. VKM F-4520 (FW-2644)]